MREFVVNKVVSSLAWLSMGVQSNGLHIPKAAVVAYVIYRTPLLSNKSGEQKPKPMEITPESAG